MRGDRYKPGGKHRGDYWEYWNRIDKKKSSQKLRREGKLDVGEGRKEREANG